MPILKQFTLVGLATFALAVIVACGGDGDDGDDAFELPPPGVYRFDVTGTAEVEFPAAGVSAAPIALQETETGRVSGELTIELRPDGSFAISAGGDLLLEISEVTGGPVTLSQNEDDPSDGAIGPGGFAMNLDLGAMLPSGEMLTGQEPLLLEGDGNPFLDSGAPFEYDPPPGWGPLPFTDGSGAPLLIIEDFSLGLTLAEGPPADEEEELSADDFAATAEAEFDVLETVEAQLQEEFADEEGDDVFCGSDQPANNPTVDITGVNFFGPPDAFRMEVFMDGSPAAAFDDDTSWSVGVSVGGQGAIAEVHERQARVGFFAPGGTTLIPESEQDVNIGDTSVRFDFPPIDIDPGTTWNVETFSLPGPNDSVACDTARGTLP